MNYSEHRLTDLPLPTFVDNFRLSCINYTVPMIDRAIEFVEQMDSVLAVTIILLILVETLRIAISKRPQSASSSRQPSSSKAVKDIKDMKKEIKSIQAMINQLQITAPEIERNLGAREQPKLHIESQVSRSEALERLTRAYQ